MIRLYQYSAFSLARPEGMARAIIHILLEYLSQSITYRRGKLH